MLQNEMGNSGIPLADQCIWSCAPDAINSTHELYPPRLTSGRNVSMRLCGNLQISKRRDAARTALAVLWSPRRHRDVGKRPLVDDGKWPGPVLPQISIDRRQPVSRRLSGSMVGLAAGTVVDGSGPMTAPPRSGPVETALREADQGNIS
jgi:hypothetical protein